MLSQIITQTPAYVWAILAALIGLGLTYTRARTMSAPRLIIPHVLFLAYGLYTMATRFNAPLLAVGAWAAALMLVVAAGWFSNYRMKGASFNATTGLFTIAGSWFPMMVILITFLVNYVLGVMGAIAPARLTDPVLITVCAFLFGLCLGLFTMRMVAVLRLKEGHALAEASSTP